MPSGYKPLTRKKSSSKNPPTTETPSKAIHSIAFHTQLIKLNNHHVKEKNASATSLYDALTTTETLFKPKDAHAKELLVHWPHSSGYTDLKVIAEHKRTHKNAVRSLHFYAPDKFFSLSIKSNNELTTKQHSLSKQWSQQDVNAVTETFTDFFQAQITTSPLKYSFNKSEFSKLIEKYRFTETTYRINNVIIKNSQRADNGFTFYLLWEDSKKQTYPLKVDFSRTQPFSTKDAKGETEKLNLLHTEESLLASSTEYKKYDLQPNQYYYSLTVYEKEAIILSLWLTLDAVYGEVKEVDKGSTLSGNEVLNIYRYFDNLLQIKNTFLCDASMLSKNNETVRVRLRVITAIVTGKTWYESKIPGLTLFECKNHQSHEFGSITQNRVTRMESLIALQTLTLNKWYKMLDQNKKNSLIDLFNKSKLSSTPIKARTSLRSTTPTHQKDNIFPEKFTLKELTTTLYNQAKEKRQITSALDSLTKLLYADRDLPDNFQKPLDSKAADFEVQSHVAQLLWGSYFWIKKLEPVATPSAPLKPTLN